LVRQQIDAQAEAIRYLNSSYIIAFSDSIPSGSLADQWVQIKNSLVGSVSSLDDTICPAAAPNKSFILNTKTDKDSNRFEPVGGFPIYEPANSFSQVLYKHNPSDLTDPYDFSIDHVDGIWIEAISGRDDSDPAQIAQINQIHADYIDFHIYACWESPGQSNPVTIGTIVRLYEPST
jgi:hypothetical protein